MYGPSGSSVTDTTSVSPGPGSCAAVSSRSVPSARRTRTRSPTTGAQPPNSPVPAGQSITNAADAPAAGAIVSAGTRLTMRPFSFSTETVRWIAFTAVAATVPGSAQALAV